MDGPAAHSIKGLTLIEANYNSAIDLLKSRFRKPQKIIDAHIEEIIKIHNCTIDKPQMLRSVYNQINAHIRGLPALNVNSDQYGSLLIMSKLPDDVKLRVAREATEVSKIDDLMGVIKQETETREACKGTRAKSQDRPNISPIHHNPTAGTFVTQGTGIQ